MTDVVIDESDDVKLRRAVKDRALPAFKTAAEVQAWLDEIDQATTVAQLRAVLKDKITALTISAAITQRQ